MVQAILFGCTMIGLSCKHFFFDKPQRTTQVLLMDWIKLGSVEAISHFSNMFLTSITVSDGQNACVGYFAFVFMFLVDRALSLWFLKLFEVFAAKQGWKDLALTGFYGDRDNPSYSLWGKQLLLWNVLALLAKLVPIIFFFPFYDSLYSVADMILAPLQDHPQALLVTVMVLLPTFLNVCMTLLTDYLFKTDHHEPIKLRKTGGWTTLRGKTSPSPSVVDQLDHFERSANSRSLPACQTVTSESDNDDEHSPIYTHM
jgi:hypothetical protein